MYKQLPSRNQRSKGIRVKHVVQICVLLAICFWLVYQVKRSHDKRKEFDEHENSLNTEKKEGVIKLGRRDLHPRGEVVILNRKYDEEMEEDEATGEEEEKKHEEEEKQDNTTEEVDDELSGGEDEEVDEHDQENSDAKNDQVEEHVVDEGEKDDSDEQESDEKDSEISNDQTKNGSNEGSKRNTHEAREENYKADDASSEVAHDTQTSGMVNKTLGLDKSNEHREMIQEPQITSNGTLEGNADENHPVKTEDGEISSNATPLAATTSREVNETTASNSTATEGSIVQPEVANETVKVDGNTSESTQLHDVEGNETLKENSTLQIIAPYPGNTSTVSVNETQHDSNSTIYTSSETIASNSTESLKLPGDTGPSVSVVMSNEDTKDSTTDDASSEALTEPRHEIIDSSNSSTPLETKDGLIHTESSHSADEAAE